MQLEKLLTFDNLYSYSTAVSKVGECLYMGFSNGYSKIVMPSRGAYPFYYHGLKYYYNFCKNRKDFMGYAMSFNELYLPFTADLGSNKNNQFFNSSSVRRFWVKLLTDLMNNKSSPYTKYYNHLVSTIGEGLGINTFQLRPKSNFHNGQNKFLFIDTAISGQAISEIINAFDENNLEYFIILIVSNNGQSLKPEYQNKINNAIALSKLKLVYSSSIFSEDTSPILNSGIASLVFENLVDDTFNSIKEFRNNNFIGCGLWHLNSVANINRTELKSIQGTIEYLINHITEQTFLNKMVNKEKIKLLTEQIFTINKKYDILNQETTKKLVMDNISSKSLMTVTSSHILRVTIDNELYKTYKNGIKNIH
jgi:hypothetical protein